MPNFVPFMRILLFLGFLVLSVLVPVGLAQAKELPDLKGAEALLRSGQAEAAWKMLSPHEFDLAGREDFDYLLGVAALDSGRADRATLIFERVLTVDPDHAAARLDMARACFALGDYTRAREEFELMLQREDTPAAARQTIGRYLAAIEERTAVRKTRLAGYAEASIGRDSNVSGATSANSIYVPLFNANFVLGANSIKAPDSFASLGGGAELTHLLAGGVSLFAGIDLKQRSHRQWDAYDSRSVDYRLGMQAVHDRDTVRLSFGRNDYALDHDPYRRIGSIGLELRHAADAATQYIGFAQASEIKYLQSASASYSSDQTIAGLGMVKSLQGSGSPVLFGSVYAGEDVATRSRADGDRALFGLRGGYQRSLRDGLDAYATLSFQYNMYKDTNALFRDERRERQYDLGLGLNWRIERDWMLKPQLTYTRADSNFQIYDYRRYEFSLTLRKEFR